MKHLDPLSLAALADGSALQAAAGAEAHLRVCAQCRAELAALRALCRDLGRAPVPSSALSQATLRRLGLRPRRRLRLAWAPLLATALLAWLLPLAPPPKAPAPAAGKLTAQARTPRAHASARPTPGRAVEPVLGRVEEAASPAVGLSSSPVETPHTRVVAGAPKAEAVPMPQDLEIQVRGNLIRPGQSLVLTVAMPESGSLLAQVFDPRGRVVATLHQGPAGPGPVILQWDGVGAPSAVYTVLLKSGARSRQVKVVVAH